MAVAVKPLEPARPKRQRMPRVMRALRQTIKPMSVSDAVLELDMTGCPVVVFRHAGHGRINLVYRRPDGHIGWIDPPVVGNSKDNSSH